MINSRKWLFFFIGLFLIVLIFFLIKPYFNFVNKTLNISIFRLLFTNGNLETYDNQVNILFLGIPGGDHDGPNLSDSIMVANYNFKTNKITTISIPRDIWSDTLKDKINSAYAYGEAKKPTIGGFILAKAEVSSIVGMPIHYATVIDFNRFKELIDYVGGIDVDVENSFTDNKFPIAGKENDDCQGDPEYMCRYETINFKKGKTTMNGDTALKFVRSRNSESSEGTDFAREKRQQKVIEAVKDRIINIIVSLDVKKYEELYNLLNSLVKRDINNQHLATIVKNIIINKKIVLEKISLSEDLFYNPPLSSPDYEGLWVLVPKNDDFKYIHNFISCSLRKSSTSSDCLKNKGK